MLHQGPPLCSHKIIHIISQNHPVEIKIRVVVLVLHMNSCRSTGTPVLIKSVFNKGIPAVGNISGTEKNI